MVSLAAMTCAVGATPGEPQPKPAPPCDSCAAWNATQPPFKVYGDTYYVGVRGLSSVLITSSEGHILIDGDLPESAPKIAASIRALGFRLEDVKLILNSHVHYDHAGGIAELQRLTGAKVAASKLSAPVLREGKSGANDPQFGVLPPIPRVSHVSVFKNGQTLHVGPLAVTAHLTPGHTPGGTSWTWKSCEQHRCLNMVYADSLSAVSAPDFKFTRSAKYPHVLKDFDKSFATLSGLQCDVLLSAHPDASGFWERFDKREQGNDDALMDTSACEKYVAVFRERLAKRVAEERAK
jgi:metallo-beta-lactamase class B